MLPSDVSKVVAGLVVGILWGGGVDGPPPVGVPSDPAVTGE